MTTLRIFKIEISNFQIHVDLQNIRLVHFRNPEVMNCPSSSIELVRGKVDDVARLGHPFTPDLFILTKCPFVKYFSKQLIGLSCQFINVIERVHVCI